MPPEIFEAYVLGRLGLGTVIKNDLCDQFELSDVVEGCELIGRLVLGGWRQTMPLINQSGFEAERLVEAGYEMLKGGVESIKRLYRDIAEKSPAASFGTRNLFGWAYYNFSFKADLAIYLRELLVDVARDLGRAGRRSSNLEPSLLPECLTLSEVASALDESANSVLYAAEKLKLLQPHAGSKGVPLLIAREDFQKIEEFLDEAVTRNAAADYLNICSESFAEIVRAGHVAKLGWRGDGGDGVQDRFLKSELDRFLNSLPTNHTSADVDELLSVPEFLEYSGYDAGEFFTEVIARRLFIGNRADLDKGLNAFYLDLQLQPLGHPFSRRCISLQKTKWYAASESKMSQRQAGAMLSVSPPTIKFLADAGIIKRSGPLRHRDNQSLDRESVLDFSKKYLAAKLYAGILNCQSSKVVMVAAERGLRPAFNTSGKDSKKISPFFERRAMREAFGISIDPDVAEKGLAGWKALADVFHSESSLFAIWMIYNSFEAMISNANREWPFMVSYKFDTAFDDEVANQSQSYRICVDLELAGKEAEKRLEFFQAALSQRDIHPAITASVDCDLGIFRASMHATVFNGSSHILPHDEVVATYAADDAWRISMMMNMIKCAFEDGERTYNPKVFGAWPEYFERP
jgi:hypothetical protein